MTTKVKMIEEQISTLQSRLIAQNKNLDALEATKAGGIDAAARIDGCEAAIGYLEDQLVELNDDLATSIAEDSEVA